MKNIWIRRDSCKEMLDLLNKKDTTLIIFDTETTGLKKDDFVIQFSAIKLIRDTSGKYVAADKKNIFIKPPIPVPKQASDVNHITDEMLADKPTEEDVFNEIKTFFGDVEDKENSPVIIGYNVKFDIRMMSSMYERCSGKSFSPSLVIDTMKLAMEVVDRKDLVDESFTLKNVSALYGIVPKNLHNSAVDTAATLMLTWRITEDYCKNYQISPSFEESKPDIRITGMYLMKKSKICNFVMINVETVQNGVPVSGRFHYDIYNKRYVEDEGNVMEIGNMLKFSYCADQRSGGEISKFKDKSKSREENDGTKLHV